MPIPAPTATAVLARSIHVPQAPTFAEIPAQPAGISAFLFFIPVYFPGLGRQTALLRQLPKG